MQDVRFYKNAQDKTTLTIPNRGAAKLESQGLQVSNFIQTLLGHWLSMSWSLLLPEQNHHAYVFPAGRRRPC
jgi:hypothetical protein